MTQPACYLHPVGFGTLGYAMPAAIGGAMAVLVGIALLWARSGSLEYEAVAGFLAQAPDGTLWALLLLFGFGFAVKMALVPLHLWQARAYAETPGPASAFLGAISARMGPGRGCEP